MWLRNVKGVLRFYADMAADVAADVAQRMLARVDSSASVDPYAAQVAAAAAVGMQRYHSSSSLQQASPSAAYGLPSHPSTQQLHRHDPSSSGAAAADGMAAEGSVHRGVSAPNNHQLTSASTFL